MECGATSYRGVDDSSEDLGDVLSDLSLHTRHHDVRRVGMMEVTAGPDAGAVERGSGGYTAHFEEQGFDQIPL
jgi:hypothetical protein